MKRTMIIFLLLFFLIIPTSYQAIDGSKAQGVIIHVDDDKPADYSNIQDAIDNASDGDTIFVHQGIYYEQVIINKSINLEGEVTNKTIISNAKITDTIRVVSDQVRISGFTIRDNFCFWPHEVSAGIHIQANSTYITNNNITSNTFGIILDQDSTNTIMELNIVTRNSNAIQIKNSHGNKIKNNHCSHNDICCITLDASHKNLISENILYHNENGIHLKSSHNNLLQENQIHKTSIWGVGLIESQNNTIQENLFIDNEHALSIRFHSDMNIIIENSFDITNTIPPTDVYVHHVNNNSIYHNNFLSGHSYDYCTFGNNSWYHEKSKQGNFWAYFHGHDNNSDGIGDTSYHLKGNSENQDFYPLMYQYPDITPPKVVQFLCPESYIYYKNEKQYQSNFPIILGPLTIHINAHDFQSRVERVDLYINNVFQSTDFSKPYEYYWNEICFGKYTLKTIVYDHNGNQAELEEMVWKFF